VLELVHGDICGPISPTTPSGNCYVILLVDDVSRYMWLKMLRAKDAPAVAIKHYQAAAGAQIGHKLRAFRLGRGDEFNSEEFTEHCVRWQLTVLYTRQQNDVVEQRNQSVVGMTRSMLKSKGLPSIFWAEAVATIVYVLNRSPTKGVFGKTPFEVWHGKRSTVHHVRSFGCVAYAKNTSPN
jgi:hypothetical protein